MFDLAGLATMGPRPLDPTSSVDSAFLTEPWVSNPKISRRRVEGPLCQAMCLRRECEVDDYAKAAGRQLFLVGEAFARFHSSDRDLSVGRLTAPDLLQAYLRRDTVFLDDIKGNFSIVLVDSQAQQVLIIGSHFAVSPLYYTLVDGDVYFATSLAELGRLLPRRPEIDPAAVVEMMILNWPVHDRSLLKGVKRIAPGEIVTIRTDQTSRRVYWDQRPLYQEPPLPVSDALEHGSELFHRCANALVADQEQVCASFTSGFDSRALHAVLEKERSRILAYSFGIPGSVNVTIPERICSKLGYPFQPFILDQSYEDLFDVYARQTLILSDGFVIQRANYPYAFERLSSFAPVVVTGIFGSEFLRTFQSLGEFVSPSFARINRADDPVSELREIIEEEKTRSYLLPEVYTASQEEVETDISEWFAWSRGFDPNQRLHLYLLDEACRKYFGAEVGTERIYAVNRFPFLDIDFFEFIFRAPFAGVHTRAVRPTVADRFSSQYFYAYLIRRYRPELLPYSTDHGYAPADLLKSWPLLFAGRKHVLSRAWSRLTGYREFKTDQWLRRFYERHLSAKANGHTGLTTPKFAEDFRTGAWLADIPAFERAAALRLWLGEWY